MPENATMNTKLERFKKLVINDARQAQDETIRQAQEVRAQRLDAAEARFRREFDELRQRRSQEILADNGQEISRRLMQSKRAVAARREEIGHEVFAAVREKLLAYTETPDYLEHLKKLLSEAFSALGNPYDGTVLLREADMKYASELSKLLPGRHISFEPGSFRLGGLIVDCNSKLLRADQSYDTELSNLEAHFAELFGLSLADD